ncbi:MAG: hypothetical protein KatS3mg129_0127 [Leptospiraceae bacterium]|nr:MAG: hypothetical protein KatS3mg129_0127 [Leptospiraceae bacterium]
MKIIDQSEIQVTDIDELALRVFLKALEILGGPRKLIEYRNLTWLPSLMAASYAVCLEDQNKTQEEIAEFLGLTKYSIRNMLKADPEVIKERLNNEIENLTEIEREENKREHTAGGLAKLAFEEIKYNRDNLQLFMHFLKEASNIEVFQKDIGWSILVLKRIKGLDFPISKDTLIEKIKEIEFNSKSILEIKDKLPEQFNNPSEILKSIKQAIS